MKCNEIRDRLAGFVTGELGANEMVDVEGHLSSCELCEHKVEGYARDQRRLALLREVGEPPFDPDVFWKGIEREIQKPLTDHERTGELLPLYPDELEADELATVEAHLEECADCRARWAAYEADRAERLGALEGTTEPDADEFWAGIQKGLEDDEKKTNELHERVRLHLPLLGTGDLSAEDEALFQDHLEDCPDCRAEWKPYERDRDRLASLRESGEPAGADEFWAGIQREIRPTPVRPWYRGLPLRGVAAAAAVLLAIWLGVGPLDPSTPNEERRETASVGPTGTDSEETKGTEAEKSNEDEATSTTDSRSEKVLRLDGNSGAARANEIEEMETLPPEWFEYRLEEWAPGDEDEGLEF